MGGRKFDDFDAFANDYRSIHSENISFSGVDSFYFAEMKVRLLKQLEPDAEALVLDLGCGDGATELFMQKYFPSWMVEGIDVSEKSIAVARERDLENANYRLYNGEHIPFRDNHFDVVFMAGVLHHVSAEFHMRIINEIYRVMKPGGRLFLYEHNPLNPVTRHLVNTCVFDKDAKLLSFNYCSRLLRSGGMKIVKRRFIIFFPRKSFWTKLIFLEKYLTWLPLGGQYFISAYKE